MSPLRRSRQCGAFRASDIYQGGENEPNPANRDVPAGRLRGPLPLMLRRLNRYEYVHTLHDLLGIDVPLLNLLPEDGSLQGFE